jgi:predicted peroxiredoxin
MARHHLASGGRWQLRCYLTCSLRESYDAVVAAGVQIYASGMSSKSRGVGERDLEGKPVEFAMPNRLVQLALEADRVITY